MSNYQEISDILKRVSLAHEEHAKEIKELRENQKKNSEEFAEGMKELRENQKKNSEEFAEGMKELRENQKETDEQINKLRESQKETDEQLNKLRESQKETDEQLNKLRESQKETDEQLKKTDEQLKKTDEQVRRISRDFGGFINNSARETEEFFYKAIKKNNLKIAGYEFDSIHLNVFSDAHKKGNREMEIDILLLNSQVLAVVEVKTTLHQHDVKNFLEEQIPLFRACFPEHRDKKIIGMVAGKIVNTDARDFAHKAGFTILTPEGGNLLVDDSCQRVLN